MKVELILHSGSDTLVATAARTSFGKESFQVEGDDGKFKARMLLADSPPPSIKKQKEIQEYCEWVNTQQAIAFADRGADDLMVATFEDWKLVRFLAREKHLLPFRHPQITLRLKVPIFVARQLGKHQTGMSWSEESRRYIDSEPEFYWPETWRKRAENVKQGSSDEIVTELSPMVSYSDPLATRPIPMENVQHIILNTCVGIYNRMLEDGVAPEQARMILPQNMYTTCVWTGSLLSFVHVIHERTTSNTQAETRQVAEQIRDILTPLYPISIDALLNGETN